MWVAAEAATHMAPENEMFYQVIWKTEPGLKGLSCSEFRAVDISAGSATDQPGAQAGVVIMEAASQAEADAMARHLENYFALQRFSNNASAFETVKSYVLEQAAKNQ